MENVNIFKKSYRIQSSYISSKFWLQIRQLQILHPKNKAKQLFIIMNFKILYTVYIYDIQLVLNLEKLIINSRLFTFQQKSISEAVPSYFWLRLVQLIRNHLHLCQKLKTGAPVFSCQALFETENRKTKTGNSEESLRYNPNPPTTHHHPPTHNFSKQINRHF